jgi:hypothetical protein
MGRPLGPSGGLPGGGGTGLPEGLRGGRGVRWPGACGARCAAPASGPVRVGTEGCTGRWPIDGPGGRGADGTAVDGGRGADGPAVDGGRGADGPAVDGGRGADGPAVDGGRGADGPAVAGAAAAGAAGAGAGRAGGMDATCGSAAGRGAPLADGRAGALLPRLLTSRGRSGPASCAGAISGAGRPGGAFFAAAGAGASSGWTGRRSPSASAFLRTRSAWASSMEDEWLFTPIPSAKARSRASLFVKPSSRASS